MAGVELEGDTLWPPAAHATRGRGFLCGGLTASVEPSNVVALADADPALAQPGDLGAVVACQDAPAGRGGHADAFTPIVERHHAIEIAVGLSALGCASFRFCGAA